MASSMHYQICVGAEPKDNLQRDMRYARLCRVEDERAFELRHMRQPRTQHCFGHPTRYHLAHALRAIKCICCLHPQSDMSFLTTASM